MNDISLKMPHYPTLDFMLLHGPWLTIVLAALPLIGGAVAMAMGAPIWWLVGAIAASAVAFLLLRLLLEVLQILADFILPR